MKLMLMQNWFVQYVLMLSNTQYLQIYSLSCK